MRRSTPTWPRAVLAAALFAALTVACGPGEDAPPPLQEDPTAALVARAAALELATAYAPPPGDALEHHTSGFAKVLCSAVFITGLDPADAAENVGGFTSPFEARAAVVDTVVDFDRQEVRLTLPSGTVLAAKRYGSQGCVTRAVGEDSVRFRPAVVTPRLPDPATTPWPMGDVLPEEPFPAEVDMAKVAQALDSAFGPPEAMTQAVVVTYRGRILAERYGQGAGPHTPLESWSMGKSLTGALMGVLIQRGVYGLWQGASVPEWQGQDDPRREIRIGDLMRMSSGIRIRAPQDPDYDPELGYPDHVYLYTGRVNSFEYAATRPLQWPPNTVGRYRNTDPVLVNYLIRLAVEGTLREDYHAFPQRALFDRIGVRSAVLETDPYGNFLTQGYEYLSARDWVRLANLYLQDGVWNGERILPEGYAEYARTVAPAWEADGRPVYGGAFQWLNGTGSYPIPRDASYFSGAGGQVTLMIPSHGLAVARLGKYRGARVGGQALRRGLELLMEAVPPLSDNP
jgi:CubicO group peptidase (beta-lactamase class C family)